MLGKKTSHAINTLIVMASMPLGRYVTASELASQMQMSVSYLESLLKVLRENGFVRSTRGPGGGYLLAAPASQMSVWSVVEVLDPRAEPQRVTGEGQIDLDAVLGTAFDEHIRMYLSSTFIGDHAQETVTIQTQSPRQILGFGLKPMAPRWMPEAPNSVFQLSQFLGEPMAAWTT